MRSVFSRSVLMATVVAAFSVTSQAQITPFDDEAAWSAVFTSVEFADFEFDGIVFDQYPGATFVGLEDGVDPATDSNFSHTPTRSMYSAPVWNHATTPWQVSFKSPQRGFAMWTHDVQASVFGDTFLEFYDSNDTCLGIFGLEAYGSGHGASLWGFNGFVSDSVNISRIVLSPAKAEAIWFDDMSWSPEPASPIPTLSAWSMIALALLTLAGGTFVIAKRRREIAA